MDNIKNIIDSTKGEKFEDIKKWIFLLFMIKLLKYANHFIHLLQAKKIMKKK